MLTGGTGRGGMGRPNAQVREKSVFSFFWVAVMKSFSQKKKWRYVICLLILSKKKKKRGKRRERNLVGEDVHPHQADCV